MIYLLIIVLDCRQKDTLNDINISSPVLPPHIEGTLHSIARLRVEHHQNATPFQRAVDQATAYLGHPLFICTLTTVIAAWIGLNLALTTVGYRPIDPPPFSSLGVATSLASLYVALVILVTQRREYKLTKLLEQLSLELAMLSERKMAKVIQLLEESRRDNPHVHNRVDQEAEAMAEPADPQSVLEAIHETQIRGVGRRERPTPFKEDVSSLVRSALDRGSIRTD